VTLNFTRIDDNKTKISLSHVEFIDEQARSAREDGWGAILDKLNDVIRQPTAPRKVIGTDALLHLFKMTLELPICHIF
jgi:hypothetical protein